MRNYGAFGNANIFILLSESSIPLTDRKEVQGATFKAILTSL